MTGVAVHGLRGGTGVTSLVAALGYALQQQGERVLLLDLCPENLLRLHFNVAAGHVQGWANAGRVGKAWQECGFEILPGLSLLPYGELSPSQVAALEHELRQSPQLWARRLSALEQAYDWVIADLPLRLDGHVRPFLGKAGCDLRLRVMNVDPASFALLQRGRKDEYASGERFLLNRYNPASQLQRDLVQLWLDRHGERLVPQQVHEDLAVGEAMACKAPLGLYAPGSLAAADVESLAVWCLANRERLQAAVA